MTRDEIRDAARYGDQLAAYREDHRGVYPKRKAHTFQTPIPNRYEPTPSGDHLDPPGAIGTDFPGCVI